jgi:kynurenine formamidase
MYLRALKLLYVTVTMEVASLHNCSHLTVCLGFPIEQSGSGRWAKSKKIVGLFILMRFRTFIVGLVLSLVVFLFAQRHPVATTPTGFSGVVDLTHVIDLSIRPAELKNSLGGGHRSAPEQFATQIDAPSQLADSLWTLDQIPDERLIASLVVIDVRQQAKDDQDYQISVHDIASWEREHGQMPLGSVVMARTGWDSRWHSPSQYRNADSKGVRHFPGYSEDAAKFLVEGRNVVGLGIDTPSVDNGASKDLAVERYTLAHSVYPLENVANLDRAPEMNGVVIVAPEKISGGSRAPVRIIALVR